jgi:hypothetical protein
VTLGKAEAAIGVTSFPDFQNAGYRGMCNMNLWEMKDLRGMSGIKKSMLDRIECTIFLPDRIGGPKRQNQYNIVLVFAR